MMKQGNVLFISYDGMTDPLGQSQVIPYLIGLSKEGHTISILSFEKQNRYKSNVQNIRQILELEGIKWFPLLYTKRPPVVSTLWDIWKMRRKALQLQRKRKFDIIHCRSYISALVGLFFKKRFNTKFIFDMRGLWADERVDGGLWDLKNPLFNFIYNYFKAKERDFIIFSDVTISLTHRAKDYLLSKIQSERAVNITVIPCCTDLDLFTSEVETKTSLLKKLDLTLENFVVTYLGSIGTWYMLDEMLLFFKLLLKVKPNSIFLFVTQDDPNIIYTASEALGISRNNLRILPAFRSEVPQFLSITHLAVFFIKPLFSKIASSPTKLGEFLSCGVPVVTNSGIGDTEEIVKSNGVGYIVDGFSDNDMTKCINRIDDLMKIPKGKMTDLAAAHFSLEDGIQKYKNVYNSLL